MVKRGVISHGLGEDGVENKYTVSFGHAWCGWYTREELELKESQSEEPLIVVNVIKEQLEVIKEAIDIIIARVG